MKNNPVKNKQSKNSIGLALGSGAFRGFAHLGVIQVLQEQEVSIDMISGTSIGALVAAYYALYGEVDSLEEKILDQKSRIFRFSDFGLRGGLVSGNRYEKFIEHLLGKHTFNDTKIPLRIVATELSSGRPYVFSEGKLATAVCASASVPVVFEPAKQQRSRFVDGALSSPVPVDVLRELGAKKIIAVNLYHRNEFTERKFTFTKVALRSVRIALYNLAQQAISDADLVLNPDTSYYVQHTSPTQYFSRTIADQMIRIGRREANKKLIDLRKLLKS